MISSEAEEKLMLQNTDIFFSFRQNQAKNTLPSWWQKDFNGQPFFKQSIPAKTEFPKYRQGIEKYSDTNFQVSRISKSGLPTAQCTVVTRWSKIE